MDKTALEIRAERPEDHAAIFAVNRAAFGRTEEAVLVEELRSLAAPLSLVAADGDTIVGHILFTAVTVAHPDEEWRAVALGPMAVLPDQQKQGIGSRLVHHGIQQCRAAGAAALFVLGHAEYYPRFGFRPAAERGFHCTWDVPSDVFMLLELDPDGLRTEGGKVLYHPRFDGV